MRSIGLIRRGLIGLAGLLMIAGASVSSHGAERTCTLALVLAIDVSGSVDPNEYVLQMSGLAKAFRSEDIAAAINSDGTTGIYVTVVQWSGDTRHRQIVPWRWLTDLDSIRAFALEIERQPRAFLIYSTGIGEALAFSHSRFSGEPAGCRRRVIDVSGDGPSNEGREPAGARDLLVADGITVNGLVILESEPDLKGYYERNVIGGAASFVMSANRFEDYPEAIRRKLIREILPPITSR
ncbi:MAG: DUF1194 domain-containing protein [Hyphomicrobiaceae bacterium]